MGVKTRKLGNVVDQVVQWQSVFTGDGSTGLTAVAGRGYFIDTTSGTVTVTLPASPNQGDTITIADYAGTFNTNNVTINPNGGKIQNSTDNGILSDNNASVFLVYMDSTKGWKQTSLDTSNAVNAALYISATGGTVTTTGTNFKVHSFTGDGCFVVSCAGNSVGSNTVDYLVIAGGGGGGWDASGGGGAGGYRFSNGTASGSFCAGPSPLGAPALPVTATTYPITVGGGGAAITSSGAGNPGSNSVFSTITSAGGGHGGKGPEPGPLNAASGGSGGGAKSGTTVGSGNTPPVSPPQGNPGGTGPGSGGGGGGAGAAGSVGQPAPGVGGAGGAGLTSCITASPVARGGGGAGGNDYPGGAVSGGSGGGGNGGTRPSTAAAGSGTANTGGGGGGAGVPGSSGSGAGGSGVVIIRYKFQ